MLQQIAVPASQVRMIYHNIARRYQKIMHQIIVNDTLSSTAGDFLGTRSALVDTTPV